MSNFDLRKYLKNNPLLERDLPKDEWVDLDKSDVEDYKKQIYDLIKTAYTPIGGHANYKSPEDVTGKEGGANYKALDHDEDPEIDIIMFSKTKPEGEKFGGFGHDGEKKSKSVAVNYTADKINDGTYFAEVSGVLKDILIDKGVEVISDPEVVKRVMADKEILKIHPDGSYDRKIGGDVHTKVLVGKLQESKKTSLSESFISLVGEDDYLKHIIKMREIAKQFGDMPVIWRGINLPRSYGGSHKVKEEGSGFKGNLDDNTRYFISKILDTFNFNSPRPTFASFDKNKAKFFGSPKIFLPIDPSQGYQHPDVDDALSYASDIDRDDMEEVIKGYSTSLSSNNGTEIIFDSKDYYIIDWEHINKNSLPGKLKVDEPKTYKDVVDMLNKLIWITKKKSEK